MSKLPPAPPCPGRSAPLGNRTIAAIAAVFVIAALIYPATVTAGPAADQIALLEDRVAALEARVAELEATPSPTPSPSPSPSSTPAATPTASPTPTPTATPTPTPVPATPTPSPTATPLPTIPPSPTPPPNDPWAVAFASRPLSAPISLSGSACNGTASNPIVIENKTFANGAINVAGVRLVNCNHVVIRSVDFLNMSQGVYVAGGTNITLQDARYQNITGPHSRDGNNRANLWQSNGTVGCLVKHNKGKGGDTEDIVSIFASRNCVVEDNHFEGTNWTSNSGSGIALCDQGGSDNIARRNTLLNPGQVGIFIAGGQRCQLVDNVVIGQQRAGSNVGAYIWGQGGGGACTGHTFSGNTIRWTNAGGTANPYWNAGNCGSVAGSGNTLSGAPSDVSPWRVSL